MSALTQSHQFSLSLIHWAFNVMQCFTHTLGSIHYTPVTLGKLLSISCTAALATVLMGLHCNLENPRPVSYKPNTVTMTCAIVIVTVCVVEGWICNQEVAGSNLGRDYFAPRSTQPSIHLGSVNEYQLRLGRHRQVWLIPLADETQDMQVKLLSLDNACYTSRRFGWRRYTNRLPLVTWCIHRKVMRR